MSAKHARNLGLCLLLALTSLSCGGDTAPTITVGVVAPLNAGLTQFGLGIRNSVQLAVDEATAAGLIHAHVIVRAVDDSSDPAIGLRNAEALATDPTVIGVVGTYNSGVARGVAPELERFGIAMLSPGNTDPTLTRGSDPEHPMRPFSNYFRLVANDSQQGGVLADFAAEDLGVTRVSVITDAKQVSQGLANDFRDAFEAAGGTIVSFEVVAEGDTDYAPFAERAAAAEPELLFFGGEYDHAALLKQAAATAGLTVPLMGGDGIQAQEYIAAAGELAEGDLASSVGAPVDQEPRGAAFLEAYEAHHFTDPPSTFGPYAYDAANIILAIASEAFPSSGRVDGRLRAAIIAGTQAANDELLAPFGGAVTGDVGFDSFGDTINPVLTVYRVEGGEWKPLVTRRAQ